MIFFAATAATWKSQCGRYELAAFPDGKTRVTVQTARNGAVACARGDLSAVVKFCQEREQRMYGGSDGQPDAN